MAKIVIIHGWSDDYKSFENLRRDVAQQIPGADVSDISLVDYLSLNDDVLFSDIVESLDQQWDRQGLPREPRSVDVIVHSTGALVLRDWLTKKFTYDNNPIHRLLMLAPANFGSPIAHKGRTFIGRLMKGDGFETGTHLLKGLELASSYSWKLAEKDRLRRNYYGKGRILATTLVGNYGYTGFAAVANEDGSDGTVRLSTANLNMAYYKVNLDDDNPRFTARYRNDTAFGVMSGENHSTIVNGDMPYNNEQTLQWIIEALNVTDDTYTDLKKKLRMHTNAVMRENKKGRHRKHNPYFNGYQNTVIHVIDQDGNELTDYLLELKVNDEDSNWFTEILQRDAIRKVHVYGDNRSYRSIYIDCTSLHKYIDKSIDNLSITITAYPKFTADDERSVGYSEIGSIKLNYKQVKKLFQENRTVLMEIVVKRDRKAVVEIY
ncbi:MAG: alpha/beta hydrolase [Lentisphaeria bacterium]|nr:alpha/beta hydrolase [Lentisphaeria bacterium]NQZ67000.1 alpha/beta hydrolase [Lentisphaeria bacterium]